METDSVGFGFAAGSPPHAEQLPKANTAFAFLGGGDDLFPDGLSGDRQICVL